VKVNCCRMDKALDDDDLITKEVNKDFLLMENNL
jgi:hypothetical protein